MECPRTKKDVRTILGVTGYYREFIQNLNTIAKPLINLTRKGNPNVIALTFATVTRSPDFTKIFILHTDTSNVRVGSVLSQGDEDYPITYFSRNYLIERNDTW